MSQDICGVSAPSVTTRALIDPSRKCALRCAFCYYLPQDDFYSVRPWEDVENDVLSARKRGCDACDISGGEPMQYPEIVKLVKLCSDVGLKPRIITSLVGPQKTFHEILENGIDDWLLSMHGAKAETHDAIVQIPNARNRFQIPRLEQIAARMRYCCNYVMIEKNQSEIVDWSKWIADRLNPPRIVNFINFNPHYDWINMPDKAMANVVDLRVVGPQLDEAIDILEAVGTGVNVRYFPMCALAENHRRVICNDLQVAYDSGEWDNAIGSHLVPDAYRYGFELSIANEEKCDPCNSCDLQWVCGGANRLWHGFNRVKHGEQLVPITGTMLKGSQDWNFYRQDNGAAMA